MNQGNVSKFSPKGRRLLVLAVLLQYCFAFVAVTTFTESVLLPGTAWAETAEREAAPPAESESTQLPFNDCLSEHDVRLSKVNTRRLTAARQMLVTFFLARAILSRIMRASESLATSWVQARAMVPSVYHSEKILPLLV